MKRTVDQLRVLLLQIRAQDSIARHEFDCVVGRCGLDPDRVQAINIAKQPVPSWEQADSADVIMIGGAGVFSVMDAHSFTDPLNELVHRAVDVSKPMVGLCWGHQFIAQALGGRVVTDHEKGEAGTHRVHLTVEGKADPLFAESSETFFAHMGHNDYVIELPPVAVELARSERCPNQAFRIEDKPIYGTQFHIELDAQQLIERLTIYQEIYVSTDDEFTDLTENPISTLEADVLLKRFLALYLLP